MVGVRIPLGIAIFCCAFLASIDRSFGGLLLVDSESNFQSRFATYEASAGALTLDSVYSFNFADLGFGKLTFVRRSPNFDYLRFSESTVVVPEVITPRRYVYNYDASAPINVVSRGSTAPLLEVSPDNPDEIPPPIPEPSTWLTGALALAAIAWTQVRRRRRFVSLGA
ncbi:MAG: hypothetical protein QOI07_49 [Verrucomicrobiota bacterium]|jgi:hypothetical protein